MAESRGGATLGGYTKNSPWRHLSCPSRPYDRWKNWSQTGGERLGSSLSGRRYGVVRTGRGRGAVPARAPADHRPEPGPSVGSIPRAARRRGAVPGGTGGGGGWRPAG